MAAALVSCASAPTNFYTLQRSGGPPPAQAPAAVTPFLIDVQPVAVPAEVDQPQLLVRQSEQRVAVLDSEHWAAPLSAELRDALAADLVEALGTRDVHGLAHPASVPVYRITVEVRRFDSWPGRYARLDADWTIRGDAERAIVTCASHASEDVAPGYEALVQGHQRALARLAADLATALRAIGAGNTAACPQ
jgi:uncharacterized lipoprotein YmbA